MTLRDAIADHDRTGEPIMMESWPDDKAITGFDERGRSIWRWGDTVDIPVYYFDKAELTSLEWETASLRKTRKALGRHKET